MSKEIKRQIEGQVDDLAGRAEKISEQLRAAERALQEPVLMRLDLCELFAKQYTIPALEKIWNIMNDPGTTKTLQLKAAMALLDRGWGKPAVAIRVNPHLVGEEEQARNVLDELESAQKAAEVLLETARQGALPPDKWLDRTDRPQAIVEQVTNAFVNATLKGEEED